MVIVGEFVGGAALGAAIGVLFDAVNKAVDKSTAFKSLLENIKFSLEILKPVIEKIGDHNLELGLPDEEIEYILTEMMVGAKLVQRASKVSKWNCIKSYYTDQLIELDASVERLLHILIIQGVKDAKEILILARKHQDQLITTAKDAKETLVMAQQNTSQLTESVKDGKKTLELATKYAEQSARDRKETLVLARKIKRLLKRMVSCTNKGKTRYSRNKIPKASRRSGIETSDLRVFWLAELQAATENFRGKTFGGINGMTYEGWLHEKTLSPSKYGTGMMVVIQRYPKSSTREWTANFLVCLSLIPTLSSY
uniref:RPW8-like protein 3 n=1 Tax=Fragaria vesca subsp. vesca TaxID=101020 RepID=UPI0005C9C39B|nr:PREDICTED: RPW8-like protein 3 [Fragaria vesca subsp. vesca]XP_011464443.1 PREDICTED: RPW8-like protein 3 [Fragaria vesca subsp. vesca]